MAMQKPTWPILKVLFLLVRHHSVLWSLPNHKCVKYASWLHPILHILIPTLRCFIISHNLNSVSPSAVILHYLLRYLCRNNCICLPWTLHNADSVYMSLYMLSETSHNFSQSAASPPPIWTSNYFQKKLLTSRHRSLEIVNCISTSVSQYMSGHLAALYIWWSI